MQKINFLGENAFLRPHVADAYKAYGILTKMEAFLAQSFFWPKSAFSTPKLTFGPKIEK